MTVPKLKPHHGHHASESVQIERPGSPVKHPRAIIALAMSGELFAAAEDLDAEQRQGLDVLRN
jgi:hypothetical protein